jgi:hypothetical protein
MRDMTETEFIHSMLVKSSWLHHVLPQQLADGTDQQLHLFLQNLNDVTNPGVDGSSLDSSPFDDGVLLRMTPNQYAALQEVVNAFRRLVQAELRARQERSTPEGRKPKVTVRVWSDSDVG